MMRLGASNDVIGTRDYHVFSSGIIIIMRVGVSNGAGGLQQRCRYSHLWYQQQSTAQAQTKCRVAVVHQLVLESKLT